MAENESQAEGGESQVKTVLNSWVFRTYLLSWRLSGGLKAGQLAQVLLSQSRLLDEPTSHLGIATSVADPLLAF